MERFSVIKICIDQHIFLTILPPQSKLLISEQARFGFSARNKGVRAIKTKRIRQKAGDEEKAKTKRQTIETAKVTYRAEVNFEVPY